MHKELWKPASFGVLPVCPRNPDPGFIVQLAPQTLLTGPWSVMICEGDSQSFRGQSAQGLLLLLPTRNRRSRQGQPPVRDGQPESERQAGEPWDAWCGGPRTRELGRWKSQGDEEGLNPKP